LNDILKNARAKKVKKYEPIIREAKVWLERNKEEIGIKYKVSDIEVDCKFVIISNLGVVPKSAEEDVCSLFNNEKNERL
jgi:hypothetical protein